MIAIGIDPGLSGGIAAVCAARGLLEAERLPSVPVTPGGSTRLVDARALRALLSAWSSKHDFWTADRVLLVVERMGTFGGPTADKVPRSSLLSMGYSAGICEGTATAFTHETIRPMPRQWKKTFGLVTQRTTHEVAAGIGVETTAQRKARAHKVALMLYPQMGRVPHDVAEAVLIAHFGLGLPTPVVSREAQRRSTQPAPGDADDPFAAAAA